MITVSDDRKNFHLSTNNISYIIGIVHTVVSNNYMFEAEVKNTEAYGDELMNAGLRPDISSWEPVIHRRHA